MNPKAKSLELTDLTLYLAPLTMRQIETLVEAPVEDVVGAQRVRLWQQIEASLQNARVPQPSVEELKDQLDINDWLAVLKTMREVSGISLSS